jgi:hypothetical protein
MRKVLLGFAVLLVICAGLFFRFRHSQPPVEVAFAANREVTLQSTTAQVREPVATVNFGDRLEILQRFQDQVQVRTTKGVTGWVSGHELLSADLWQRAADMMQKAGEIPVQAVGHTKTLTNVHVDSGRDSPRIQQLGKGTSVEIVERSVVAAPSSQNAAGGEGARSTGEEPKKEDWLLVRTRSAEKKGAVDLAGWLLGKYVQLDLPRPLGDLVSTSGMRAVGWQALNFVADPSSGKKWQYLVLGAHGPEGQPCDFSMLRVYTWGVRRQRYETAFIDGKVCGKLPVKVIQPSGGAADVTFAFQDIGEGAPKERTYRMHQTIVRRVKENVATATVPRKHTR